MNENLRFVCDLAEGYGLYFGQRDDLVEQLVGLSKLPEMVATVPRDSAERFISVASFRQRPVDAQEMYWLLHGDEVAGIMWFRRKEPPFAVPEADYTIAIRIYPSHQGKGLSQPLMSLAHKDFLAHNSRVKGFWLQTKANNLKAQHAYEKFGYQLVDRNTDDVTMVLATHHLS